MPVQTSRPREGRGLHCPDCGEELGSRLIAKSYPSPAGVYRLRHCGCGAAVESSETVIGLDAEVLDVSDLNPEQVKLVRAQVEVLRSCNRS